ncbi:hypothetical protein [Geopseudomonas aromaticivorans]
MGTFSIIVMGVGIVLLLLGTVSGCALVVRALKPQPRPAEVAPGALAVTDNDSGQATLWGMFIVGLSAGLLLIWLALL